MNAGEGNLDDGLSCRQIAVAIPIHRTSKLGHLSILNFAQDDRARAQSIYAGWMSTRTRM